MSVANAGLANRAKYLDGLRGLACMQVLLLHIFTGYFPGLVEDHANQLTVAGRIQNSPLFTLYDGFIGVYIFFYLSGYVLTGAFERSGAKSIDEIQARIVRLWVPTICFAVWSLSLFLVFHGSHAKLSAVVNSDWLGHCWSVDMSMLSLAKEIFVTPLFSGYQDTPMAEIFPGLKSVLPDSGTSLNSPVWTMSAELQGSMLVLGFVRLRRKAPVLWASLLCCVVVWLPETFAAFAFGHLAGVMRLADREYRGPRGLVSCLAILFIMIGVSVAWPYRGGTMLLAGSGLMFIGVISSPIFRKILSHPLVARLGDLSFTIYLIHWAVVFGPGSWLILKTIPLLGLQASRIVGAMAVMSVVIWLSTKMVVVDRFTIALAQAVKRGQTLSVKWIPVLGPGG